MSLLICRRGELLRTNLDDFTFQYVSINITAAVKELAVMIYFTFQYVSINIDTAEKVSKIDAALHSNMSLLIFG